MATARRRTRAPDLRKQASEDLCGKPVVNLDSRSRDRPAVGTNGPKPRRVLGEHALCLGLGVRMGELRDCLDQLRTDFAVPYPLADRRPWVSGRELVYEAQDRSHLDPEFWIVNNVGGQLLLLPSGDEFYRRVTWSPVGVAAAWRPADNERSTVVIDPDRRFGKPSVAGISAEAIWEHASTAEDEDEIATTFNLSLADVRWALSYETARRAA